MATPSAPLRPTGASDLITETLSTLHERCTALAGGEVASYIPELAGADPDLFGLAVASVTGSVYTAGDADVPFTIQSLSKPFVYGLALDDLGLERVVEQVGAEPSGEGFSSIRLEPDTGRPPNAMVNAGAIVSTSLVAADDDEHRFARILATLSAYAGRELDVDERVYASESATGDRNRAIAYLMHNAGSLRADVETTLETYFRQCAVRVTARDLAVMSTTLANGGINPVTGERVASEETTERVLAVMATCGMYDYAGEWLLRAGLPAKSGVSGGLVCVGVGQFGLGLFSPPLDARGNPVRAVTAAQQISQDFHLHLMHRPTRHIPALFTRTTVDRLTPFEDRTPAERRRLRHEGAAISIRSLQGVVEFAAAEKLLRSVDELPALPGGRAWLVLDLTRASEVLPNAERFLERLTGRLEEGGVRVAVADPFERGLVPAAAQHRESFDGARRWCEDELLALA